jgi:hypothetical protein
MEVAYDCEVFSLMALDPVGLSRIPWFFIRFSNFGPSTKSFSKKFKVTDVTSND